MIGSGDEKEDEDLDGVPLDGAALLKSALMRGIPGAASSVTDSPSHERLSRIQDTADSEYEDDIDGIPCMFYLRNNFKHILFSIINVPSMKDLWVFRICM